MYIGIEVLLTIVLSIFTAGAGGAAKVAMVSAKMLSGFKAAKAAKKLSHAETAIGGLVTAVKVFSDSAKKFKTMGMLLTKRMENKKLLAAINQTKTAKVKNEKREEKCKVCGKTGHSTMKNVGQAELTYI